MSDRLSPINPLAYIAEHMPAAEAEKSVPAWFKTERMELNFGDYMGRPSENIQVRSETLPSLFQQGWYVTAVRRSAEDGEWERVTLSASSASSQSSSTATSQGQSSSSARATNASQSHSTQNQFVSAGSSRTTADSSGTNTSTGENSNTGTETATGTSSDTTNETQSDPYWCAYALLRLERRRMQADAVLSDMVSSFVKAYNEGRRINVERYDEIVALYALMLSRTEDEANALTDGSIDFAPLFEQVKSAVATALAEYKDAADTLPADWLSSRKAEVNRKFDALVGEARAKMVSNGTYNSTVWPTTLAGIERQRQYALVNLKDETVKLRLEAHKDIAATTADVMNNLVAAQVRIFEALQKQRLDPTNLRNTVFKWMLDFMEKREDAYPGLDQLPTVAEKLGYSGGIVAPASVVQQ